MDPETFQFIRSGLIFYIILASSIAIHEWAHAVTADRLGDSTPRQQERVTLNPLAHLDPIGTGLIPLFMIFSPLLFGGSFPLALIGWGRPVQVNVYNFRKRVRDHLLVTAAGPASNLVIALGAAFVGGILSRFIPGIAPLFGKIIMLNVALIIFNMIPIPPLDGSHFLRYAVGMSEETYTNLSRWGFLILLVLINLQFFRILMFTPIIYLTYALALLTAGVGGISVVDVLPELFRR